MVPQGALQVRPRRLRVLLALPGGPAMPAARVRVLQYVPTLEASGFECTVMSMRGARATARTLRTETDSRPRRWAHLAGSWLAAQAFQARLLLRAGRYDRLLLHRVPISAWARPLLARHRERLVFDFDDALYDTEAAGLGAVAALRRRVLRRSLERAVGIAAVVTTSNDRNAEWARSMGACTCIVPTSVDTTRVGPRSRSRQERLVIGWMGTPSTSRYLTLVEDVLEEVAQSPVIVRLVGALRNPFRRLQAEVRPWTLEAESEELASFDVGIMPMPDTAWTRGKAAFKALQYGAASVPTVASWTPTNEEILGDGEGAILCRSAREWKVALDRLVADEELRRQLGERGRRRVTERYSVEVNGPRLARALLEAGVPRLEERS